MKEWDGRLILLFSLFLITNLLLTGLVLDSNSKITNKVIVVEKEIPSEVIVVEKEVRINDTELANKLIYIYSIKQILSRESGGEGGLPYMKWEARRWDRIADLSNSQDAIAAFNHISLAIEYQESGSQERVLNEWLEFLKYAGIFIADFNELVDITLLEAVSALKG